MQDKKLNKHEKRIRALLKKYETVPTVPHQKVLKAEAELAGAVTAARIILNDLTELQNNGKAYRDWDADIIIHNQNYRIDEPVCYAMTLELRLATEEKQAKTKDNYVYRIVWDSANPKALWSLAFRHDRYEKADKEWDRHESYSNNSFHCVKLNFDEMHGKVIKHLTSIDYGNALETLVRQFNP